MVPPSLPPASQAEISHRSATLLHEHQHRIYVQTDRLFAVLMLCQWIAGIGAACWISPRTWIGTSSAIHIHVWAAILLGCALNLFPAFLALTQPGTVLTRHVIAAGQVLTSALLIHLTGGRIETHFHVFGSLAFLAAYRDWRVLVTATALVALDHFFRGVFWPQSVFGVLTASSWRWVEHAGWVIFEDIVLIRSCWRSQQEMREIAAQRATLEKEIEERSKVEEQLRNQAQKVAQGATRLTSATQEITTSLTQVMAAVTETAAAVTQTTATVEEVKQTAYVASQKARNVSAGVQQTAEVSQAGAKAVADVRTEMAHVQQQMQAIAESVGHLNEKSQAIQAIMDTVKDLAERSNLLAINAAIEAAKAGEQGKGFAVVAQEVRHLATQSKQATAQVRTLLTGIQQAAHSAVLVTKQGTQAVDVGLHEALKAGESIQLLSTQAQEVAQTMTQIDASSQQQLVGMDQAAQAMLNIKTSSQQNAVGLSQIEGTARNLRELGQSLAALVGLSTQDLRALRS